MTGSKAYFDFGAHHGDGLRQMTEILGVDGSWEIHLFNPIHLWIPVRPYTITRIRCHSPELPSGNRPGRSHFCRRR